MNKKIINSHIIASKKLDAIMFRTFNYIKKNIGKVSEKNVEQFILKEFKKENLITDRKKLIVAVNKNSAIPHYYPNTQNLIIKKNNLIKIDIWAREKGKKKVFSDITWMAYTGKAPKKIINLFNIVLKARNKAIKFIKTTLSDKLLPYGKEIDKVVRNYFKKICLDNYFIHGTGHSLGFNSPHGRDFKISKKEKNKIKKKYSLYH